MKSNIPKTAALFIIALPVLTAARYLQYSTVVNPENGFFELNGGFLNIAYYVFLVASVIMAAVFAFWDMKTKRGLRKGKITRISVKSSVVGGMIMAAAGFLFAYEAAALFLGGGGALVFSAFLLAAAGFTLTGFALFSYGRLFPLTGFAFLLLTLFYTFRAADEFMARINVTSISARLIILLVNLTSALFFLSCGKIFMRAQTKFTPIFTAVCGYTASLLIFSDGAARLAHLAITDRETAGFLISAENGFNKPEPSFFFQGAAVLWLIFTLSVKTRRRKTDEDSE
ncbi:MAG: hypothetical protein LBI38_03125 [Oscillospiraceae bacterium]|jgi:hypothetical protein|nr:hypothetical protein [Oscillospiraceae bacterium]